MGGREHSARREEDSQESAGGNTNIFAGRQAGWGAISVIAASIVGGILIWSQVSPEVRRNPEYVLGPDQIAVTGVPSWVQADLKQESLRNASLDIPLQLDDPELTRRLARAFNMHPWVKRVVRVKVTHPAGAQVEVQCREPVAMVAVSGGLFAIDNEGVVLPSRDFTAEEAARYPRITGIVTSPLGPEGQMWGDPAVQEAAAVAVALGPEWSDLNLTECQVVSEGGRRAWVLKNEEGSTIRFGSAPGQELSGEPHAAAKIARLRAGDVIEDGLDLSVDP